MASSNIVDVDIYIRDGSRGTQAMWAAYRCPLSCKTMTVWGTLKTPTGATPTFPPNSQPQVDLVFSNSKETSSELSKLYAAKRKKYRILGRYALDVTNLQTASTGSEFQNNATPTAVKSNKKGADKPSLPKELTHPEVIKSGNSTSPNWFF